MGVLRRRWGGFSLSFFFKSYTTGSGHAHRKGRVARRSVFPPHLLMNPNAKDRLSPGP